MRGYNSQILNVLSHQQVPIVCLDFFLWIFRLIKNYKQVVTIFKDETQLFALSKLNLL